MLIVGSSPLSDLGTQSLLLLKLPKHFDIILNLTCLMYLPSRTTVSSRGVFAHLENRLLILFFHLPTMGFCQDHYCSQWCGRPRRCNPKVFPKMSTQMRRAWTWSNDSSFRWWPFQTTKELLTLPLHRRNSTISLVVSSVFQEHVDEAGWICYLCVFDISPCPEWSCMLRSPIAGHRDWKVSDALQTGPERTGEVWWSPRQSLPWFQMDM